VTAQPPPDPFAAAWLVTAALLLLAGFWPCAPPPPEACPAPHVFDSRGRAGASPVVACDLPGGRALDAALPILFGGRLDLARADAAALDVLPGVGPTLAARIVAERERAPFCALAELGRVPGIGPRTRVRLDPWLEPGHDARCEQLSRPRAAP
jgi:hypothetical protein